MWIPDSFSQPHSHQEAISLMRYGVLVLKLKQPNGHECPSNRSLITGSNVPAASVTVGSRLVFCRAAPRISATAPRTSGEVDARPRLRSPQARGNYRHL